MWKCRVAWNRMLCRKIETVFLRGKNQWKMYNAKNIYEAYEEHEYVVLRIIETGFSCPYPYTDCRLHLSLHSSDYYYFEWMRCLALGRPETFFSSLSIYWLCVIWKIRTLALAQCNLVASLHKSQPCKYGRHYISQWCRQFNLRTHDNPNKRASLFRLKLFCYFCIRKKEHLSPAQGQCFIQSLHRNSMKKINRILIYFPVTNHAINSTYGTSAARDCSNCERTRTASRIEISDFFVPEVGMKWFKMILLLICWLRGIKEKQIAMGCDI